MWVEGPRAIAMHLLALDPVGVHAHALSQHCSEGGSGVGLFRVTMAVASSRTCGSAFESHRVYAHRFTASTCRVKVWCGICRIYSSSEGR
jgi:hypothetical protein